MKVIKINTRIILCTMILLVCSAFSFGQSADFFTGVLEAEKTTWEQAVFLVLGGSERIAIEAAPADAWQSFTDSGWFTKLPDPKSPITTAQYSYIISKAFNVKGGLWYTLFKSQRYSYRELVHKGVVPGSFDPSSAVKGTEALKIVDKAISLFPVNNVEDK